MANDDQQAQIMRNIGWRVTQVGLTVTRRATPVQEVGFPGLPPKATSKPVPSEGPPPHGTPQPNNFEGRPRAQPFSALVSPIFFLASELSAARLNLAAAPVCSTSSGQKSSRFWQSYRLPLHCKAKACPCLLMDTPSIPGLFRRYTILHEALSAQNEEDVPNCCCAHVAAWQAVTDGGKQM